MKKKNQQLYSSEREYFPLPFMGEQMGLGSSSRVCGKTSSLMLALTSVLSFATILLSLFTLNYSSIFSLAFPTAHAADPSTTDLSLDIPTMLGMSITGSDPQCTGDEIDTSEGAPSAGAQLCLDLNRETVSGTQTVEVRTNDTLGYTISSQHNDLNRDNDRSSYFFVAQCSLDGGDACAMNVVAGANDSGVFEDSHKFKYSVSAVDGLRSSAPAGDYKGAVKYTVTANTDSGSQIINDDKTVYAYDYTGARQYFVTPKDGKYKLEVWGAGLCTAYRSCGGYSVGAVNLKAGDKLYVYVGGHGAGFTVGFNGGGVPPSYALLASNGNAGSGATHIATIDGVLSSLSNNRDSVLIVAGGGGGTDGNTVPRGGSNAGGYLGNTGDNDTGGLGGGQSEDTVTPLQYRGSFGQGGTSGYHANRAGDWAGCGGGGWYGGAGANSSGQGGGGGGSGYIGNSRLLDVDASTKKHMYGYNVATSNEDGTRTITGTCANGTATTDCAKGYNGYAKMTYLGAE